MELGDMAGWAGCVTAALSLGWHVWNELRAMRAALDGTLTAQTQRTPEGVLVHILSRDPMPYTQVIDRLRVVSPPGAVLALATATDPNDLTRLSPFGRPSRRYSAPFMARGRAAHLRVFVLGLPDPKTPFVLDARLIDAASRKTLLRRRRWAMMGRGAH
jgi:hypothetical protein